MENEQNYIDSKITITDNTTNLHNSSLLSDYVEHRGVLIRAFPELAHKNLTPLSISELMVLRLNSINNFTDRKTLLDNSYISRDAVVYNTEGKIKIILDSDLLKNISPNSNLYRGGLVISERDYKLLPGEEFNKREIERYTHGQHNFSLEQHLTLNEVLENPFLEILSRDRDILKDYSAVMFKEAETKQRRYTAMGVRLTHVVEYNSIDAPPTLYPLSLGAFNKIDRSSVTADSLESPSKIIGKNSN